MKYIRDYYNVPAKRGMCVVAEGRKGIIVGSNGHYLCIKIEGEKRTLSFHPTWRMEYFLNKKGIQEQGESGSAF